MPDVAPVITSTLPFNWVYQLNQRSRLWQRALGKGVFLLALNNDTSRAVTDYWLADGYLEYVSPDGTPSHIPLEALDLQNTVTQNASRGLPFVLRSA